MQHQPHRTSAEPRPYPPPRRRVRGFTLVELMITIVIAAILLTIAVPSFKATIARTNLGGTYNDMLSTLRYARSEAVTRGAEVSVEAVGGDWDKGWEVKFPDPGGGPDEVLRAHDALAAQYKITVTPAGTTQLKFDPRGGADGQLCFEFADIDAGSPAAPVRLMMLGSGSTHSVDNC